ncbi:hypothetical protein K504DRAFT_494223 [Pleomassaria siparia CBS 279.74]|uniref:C2H2-type domain-containing protein n=1 Tax=Pleomassaria siparia CBS 279.74 TaxID=1314801 RepID=A0A6G1JXP4_9PLEO|nr:hypothetical protein K504DRAFT_494223 [Pleomassaria siparia CBS 279.74]
MEQGTRKASLNKGGPFANPLASRLAASAAGLARNVVGCSSANDLSTSMSSRSRTEGKISGASSSALASSRMEDLGVQSSRARPFLSPDVPDATFRSPPSKQNAQNAQHAFEEFLHSGLSIRPELGPEASILPTSTPTHIEHRLPLACTQEQTPYVSKDTRYSNNYVGHMPEYAELTDAKLEGAMEDDSRTMDGQALSRLEMILRHIAETSDLSASIRQHHLFRSHHDELSQQEIAALDAITRCSYLFRSAHVSACGSQHSFQHDLATASGQWGEHQTHHKSVQRDNPQADQAKEKDGSTIDFHCSWSQCHQRFENAIKYPRHRMGCARYPCPHEDCTAQFRDHDSWTIHIAEPHHEHHQRSARTVTDFWRLGS